MENDNKPLLYVGITTAILGIMVVIQGSWKWIVDIKNAIAERKAKQPKLDRLADAIEEVETLDEAIEATATAFVLSVNSFNELPGQSRKLFAELVMAIGSRELEIQEINLNLDDESLGGVDELLKTYGKSWVAEFAPNGALEKLGWLGAEAMRLGYIQDRDKGKQN